MMYQRYGIVPKLKAQSGYDCSSYDSYSDSCGSVSDPANPNRTISCGDYSSAEYTGPGNSSSNSLDYPCGSGTVSCGTSVSVLVVSDNPQCNETGCNPDPSTVWACQQMGGEIDPMTCECNPVGGCSPPPEGCQEGYWDNDSCSCIS